MHCQKGCRCKASGDCYDCETGYYMQNGKCKRCSTGCLACSSNITCEKCDDGYYEEQHENEQSILCHPCAKRCKHCLSDGEFYNINLDTSRTVLFLELYEDIKDLRVEVCLSCVCLRINIEWYFATVFFFGFWKFAISIQMFVFHCAKWMPHLHGHFVPVV
jgi:myosin-crossreactive antigen